MSAVPRPVRAGVLAACVLAGSSSVGAQERDSLPDRFPSPDPPAPILLLSESVPLGPVPPGAVPLPAPAPAADMPGSLGLALGETLLVNVLPWAWNEYLWPYKDITRTSPSTWKANLTRPKWDDNHFHVNMLMHPLQGNYYFNAGRSNGFNFESSFLLAVLGSALWECCGESHAPSVNDLLTTTLGGAALGEVFHRWGSHLLSAGTSRWREAGVFVLTPTRQVTRWVLGHPAPSTDLKGRFELSPRAEFFRAVGWRSSGDVFGELGIDYGDLAEVRRGDRPFSYFEAAAEASLPLRGRPDPENKVLDRFQVRGILWPLAGRRTGRLGYHLVPFLGMDYLNRPGSRFGGPGLGLSGAVRLGDQRAPHFTLAADGHLLFGGVHSAYAHVAEYENPGAQEREREYDFGLGPGFGAAVSLQPSSRLRMRGSFRRNWLQVQHGSNVGDFDADHVVTFYGVSVVAPLLWWKLGIGSDARWFRSRSSFDNPAFAPVPGVRDFEWRVFVTWDRLDPVHLKGWGLIPS